MAERLGTQTVVTIKDAIRSEILAQGVLDEEVIMLEGYYYFAPEKVNMQHLLVSDRVYVCPYKGNAYWIDLQGINANVRNVAWVYPEPKTGYERIAGRIGFYTTRTRAVEMKVEERESNRL